MPTFPAVGSTNWGPPLLAHLQQSSTFNSVDYGAVADATTNNAAAINAAVTAASAAGGGIVLVPAAALAWGFGSAIVAKSNVTLLLYGTLKALSTHAGVGVDISSAVTNFSIAGPGTIDMNKAATTSSGGATPQHCVSLNGTSTNTLSGITVRDVTLINSWQDGFSATAISTAKYTGVLLDNVTVNDCGSEGIDFRAIGDTAVAAGTSTSRDIRILRCKVNNPGANGIRCRGVSDVTVHDNTVLDAGSATGHGICMGAGSLGVTDDQATDFTVSDNRVRGFVTASQWGICVSARCTRFSVVNNKVRSCTNGITFDVKDPNNVSTLIDCDASVTGNQVVACVGTSAGIRTNQAKNLTLLGNVVRGCTGSGPGIAINNSLGLTAVGNESTGNVGIGLQVGVVGGAVAGTGAHRIQSNNVTGNTGGNYSVDATVPLSSDLDASLDSAATAEVNLTNTVTETQLFGTTISANTAQVATTYRVTVALLVDNVATSGTLTLRLKWGGVGGVGLATAIIPTQAGAATGQKVHVEYLVTIRSAGAAGTAFATGIIRSQFSAYSDAIQGTQQTIDTTADKSLSFTAAWATASASNVCKLEIAAFDVVKS